MGARTGVPCLSGHVSGVSGPRGVPSAVCGGGGAPALKFLFCGVSCSSPAPLASPRSPTSLSLPFSFHTQDAQTPSCSDMLPLLLWAGEWTAGRGSAGRGLG